MLNLKVEMYASGISIEDVSCLLNVHRNTVSAKLNGKAAFSIGEAFEIKEKFFPDADLKYLFSDNGEKK